MVCGWSCCLLRPLSTVSLLNKNTVSGCSSDIRSASVAATVKLEPGTLSNVLSYMGKYMKKFGLGDKLGVRTKISDTAARMEANRDFCSSPNPIMRNTWARYVMSVVDSLLN